MDDLFSNDALQGKTLTRTDVEALIGSPRTLMDCGLEDADLSNLNLTGWKFERCNWRRSDLKHAKL